MREKKEIDGFTNPNVSEAQIQTKIANKLKKNGWFVTKLIQTSTNGIPDLLCIRNGHVLFLEVKKPGEQPTELQKYMIEQIRAFGLYASVVTSVDDIDVFCYKFI